MGFLALKKLKKYVLYRLFYAKTGLKMIQSKIVKFISCMRFILLDFANLACVLDIRLHTDLDILIPWKTTRYLYWTFKLYMVMMAFSETCWYAEEGLQPLIRSEIFFFASTNLTWKAAYLDRTVVGLGKVNRQILTVLKLC